MKIGYARVSTDDQNLYLQHRALKEAGCKTIYDDQGISGASFERRGLNDALNATREGQIWWCGNSTVWGVPWAI